MLFMKKMFMHFIIKYVQLIIHQFPHIILRI